MKGSEIAPQPFLEFDHDGKRHRVPLHPGSQDHHGLLLSEWTETPGRIVLLIHANVPITLQACVIETDCTYPSSAAVWANGLQSWTETREFYLDERIPPLRGPLPRLINTTGDYTFYKPSGQTGHFHSHWTTSIRYPSGNFIRYTETLDDTGYTIFEHRSEEGKMFIRKDCAGTGMRVGDSLHLFHINIERENPAYSSLELDAPVHGWTSWYNYYTKIDEEIILSNLQAFVDQKVLPGVFQIDDGWQSALGDWTSCNKKFPSGMKALADGIHSAGHKAGLWLAPFIVEQKSSIYQEHRDWLLTHDGEHLVAAGFNPGWGGMIHGTYYVLDFSKPEVQAHLEQTFHVILQEWGFDLVKLDFLFAAGLIPREGKNRGQWMREGMEWLRKCCRGKLILGCGVPLQPAAGLVDYCRIGPDVGLRWDMKSARMLNLRERISTHNALRNTIWRLSLPGKGFRNDPDVFILRDGNNHLSPVQRRSGFILNNLLGDLIFTSDHIGEYDAQTNDLYHSAFPLPIKRKITLIPDAKDRLQIEAEIDNMRYRVSVNLTDEPYVDRLPPGLFFDAQKFDFVDGTRVEMQPFEVRVFVDWAAWHKGILGSTRHLFPGCEVDKITWDGNTATLIDRQNARREGTVWVFVPFEAETVIVNGQEAKVLIAKNQLRYAVVTVS